MGMDAIRREGLYTKTGFGVAKRASSDFECAGTAKPAVNEMFEFKYAVMGGTFDHLHAGHRALLDAAFERADHVTIGVTSDRYIAGSNKKFKEMIQPCEERKRILEEYLKLKGYADRGEVCEVDGAYSGVRIPDENGALFVSKEDEGIKTAEKINKLRENKGLKKIAVVEIEIDEGLLMTAWGEKLSSTGIRRYLVNREKWREEKNGEV